MTNLPEPNINAVALGSRRRMMTAAKRRGLNSVLRQRSAICFRSNRTPRSALNLFGFGGEEGRELKYVVYSYVEKQEMNNDEYPQNQYGVKHDNERLTRGRHVL